MRRVNYISMILRVIILIFSVFTISVFADDSVDLNFTDSTGDEFGENWNWDYDLKTLTLSGVNFTKGIILPENSFIKIEEDTINKIIPSNEIPIVASGNLTILGKGTLFLTATVDSNGVGYNTISGVTNLDIDGITLNTSGVMGLVAENISIKNSILDIYGYRHGISVTSSIGEKNLSVEIINSTGVIKGNLLQGIEISNTVSGDVELVIEKCNKLKIEGNMTNKKLSGTFERSGVRLYTFGARSNASVSIKESKDISFYGTNTGIAIDCHSDDSTVLTGNGKSSLLIEESTVIADTTTNTWAAFFVNNNGIGKDAIADITIKNSKVGAFAPNDVAIMTSTKNTISSVTVKNSILELAGVYAGIRAKSNTSSDAEIFVIEDSLIVVVDKTSSNYKALDEMDNATSSDGLSGVSENSKVISPKDCEIVINEDGTWEVPDDGTILVNGEEQTLVYGGVIKEKGDVLPYITSLNDKEYTDLNEALANAKDGENVNVLIADETKETMLPLGITLTSPSQIPVNTNEYGYKVLEEIKDEKYVYSVIPKTKYKVIYHLNNNDEVTIIKEVFENSDYELESDIFESPEGMEFVNWTIDDKIYNPGDIYQVTNEINIYANWKIKEKEPEIDDSLDDSNNDVPQTYDGILNTILITFVSLIGLIISVIYLKKQYKN